MPLGSVPTLTFGSIGSGVVGAGVAARLLLGGLSDDGRARQQQREGVSAFLHDDDCSLVGAGEERSNLEVLGGPTAASNTELYARTAESFPLCNSLSVSFLEPARLPGARDRSHFA